MKKAFTLVEMLGILVVLSLLVLVSYFGITTMNRKSKENEFNDYKKSLYMSAETYINTKNIDVTGEYIVNVNILLNENYIDKVVKNPYTEKEEYNAKIKVKKDNAGVLVFEYINE